MRLEKREKLLKEIILFLANNSLLAHHKYPNDKKTRGIDLGPPFY